MLNLLIRRSSCASAVVLLVTAARAAGQVAPVPPPQPLVHLETAPTAPIVLTLPDALRRAADIDAQFQASAADAAVAAESRVQAKAGLLPSFSFTTQYIGNRGDTALLTGRFVSMDGVNMYRSWAMVHAELSDSTIARTPLRKAQAEEAVARARLEIARRGLAVTVTQRYYALVTAERRYATTQLAVQQAARFLEITQQQERLGQVARSDVVKADIQSRQQQHNFAEAALGVEVARLQLAVLVSADMNEGFSVVDDLRSAPALPPLADVRQMAERENPDLRAATAALEAAGRDIRLARSAFYPSISFEGIYGIEANAFALHSVVAAQPELGVLPNLGYAVTANLTVPVWDWGGLRSRLHQSQIKARQAQVELSQTQRQLVANLFTMYNEALTARATMDNLRTVADLAAESLRLTALRYQAGESTALEVVDAQNTYVQSQTAVDDAEARYRVALAELQTLTGAF